VRVYRTSMNNKQAGSDGEFLRGAYSLCLRRQLLLSRTRPWLSWCSREDVFIYLVEVTLRLANRHNKASRLGSFPELIIAFRCWCGFLKVTTRNYWSCL
jgi:hypothetical protein